MFCISVFLILLIGGIQASSLIVPKEYISINPPYDPIEFEKFLDMFFTQEMAKLRIPGAVFVLVNNGDVLLEKGWGFSDIEKQYLADPEKSVFKLGPLSKFFTASAVMQLEENGLLNLRDDVNKRLKTFKLRYEFETPVTILNLLTHTAGLDKKYIGTSSKVITSYEPLNIYLSSKMPEIIYPPGSTIEDSDHGYALLGYMVEEATGIPFPVFMDENIFKPLGMENSSFSHKIDIKSKIATGYDYEKGDFFPVPPDYSNLVPSLGFMSTASDVGKFLIAFLDSAEGDKTEEDKPKVLQEKTVEKMTERYYSFHPDMPGIALGLVENSRDYGQELWIKGGIPGFYGMIYLLPDQDIGFFVAINRYEPALAEKLVTKFLERYYPAIGSDEEELFKTGFADQLKSFEGVYRLERLSANSIEMAGNFFGEYAVEVDSEGLLTLKYPKGTSTILSPINLKKGFFKSLTDDKETAFRVVDGKVTHMFLGIDSLRKLGWYEKRSFHITLLAIIVIIFATAIVEWPFDSIARRMFTHRPPPPLPNRIARLIAWFMCVLNVVFIAGLVYVYYYYPYYEFRYGLPFVVKIILTIPMLSALLTIIVFLFAKKAWKAGWWGGFGRMHYSLVTLASLAFYWLICYWNLFGFWNWG